VVKPDSSKVFFPNLDGLRSIAALAVFFQHGFPTVVESFNRQRHGVLLSALLNGIFDSGHLGVSFFLS